MTGLSFTFVNTSKPGEALTPQNRKLIRGNATLRRQQKYTRNAEHQKKENADSGLSFPLGLPLSPCDGSMQEHMWSMLKYQETVIGPSTFPLKVLHDFNPAQRIMMCMAMQDDKVLNSAVAVASLRLRLIEKLSGFDAQKWQTTALRHKQKALQLVKTHMSTIRESYIDVPTAICMMQLALLELMVLNERGWQAHRTALKQLAQHPNSRASISMARYTIMDVDIMGSYIFDRQPVFSLQDFEDDSTLLTKCGQIDNAENSCAIAVNRHPIGATVPHETLAIILDRMRDVDDFINQGSHNSYLQFDVQRYLNTRFYIEHALFDLLSNRSIDDVSKTICYAAQVYVNTTYRTFHTGSELPHRIAGRLRNAISKVISEALSFQNFNASILWAAMMGGIRTRDEESRIFFTSAISILCNELELTTWRSVQIQLTKMPWSEAFVGAECKSLWEESQKVWTVVGL